PGARSRYTNRCCRAPRAGRGSLRSDESQADRPRLLIGVHHQVFAIDAGDYLAYGRFQPMDLDGLRQMGGEPGLQAELDVLGGTEAAHSDRRERPFAELATQLQTRAVWQLDVADQEVQVVRQHRAGL